MTFLCYTNQEILDWINGKSADNGFFDHMLSCDECNKKVDNLLYIVKRDYIPLEERKTQEGV